MKIDVLPLVQAVAGLAFVVGLFASPLPWWAALLIVAVLAFAAAAWAEAQQPARPPAPAAAQLRPGGFPRSVLDDGTE